MPDTDRQRFKYYLHDNYDSGERREVLEAQGVELTEEAWEAMDRPFYEILLECAVDPTGKVTILRAGST